MEYADSLSDQECQGNHGADYKRGNTDGSDTIGPKVPRYPWKRVFSKTPRYDERSDGLKDVEDLLERSDSRDGSRYFPKEFYSSNEMEDLEPKCERKEPSSEDRSKSDSDKKSGRRNKKKTKKSRKGKEPIRPKGFDKFMSSISRAGGSSNRNPATEALSSISVRHNARNVPLGVHFNKYKGRIDSGVRESKGKHL